MYKEIVKELPFKVDKIIKTNKGLTNDNYIIEIDRESFMLRYPLKDVRHLFNPSNEEKVIESIKKVEYILPVKYYNNGIQITPFIKHLTTFNQANKKTRIKDVANLMKRFHMSNIKVDFYFDPLKQIQLYKDNIKNKDIDLNQYKKVLDKLRKHTFKAVLCHNDWVEGNICFIKNKAYLIDFEYAGNNDPLFDVMSFLTENDLTNWERKEFLNEMFENGINKKDYETLKMYRDINNLLWYLWALMMYEFRSENIYMNIAKVKLNQLNNEYLQDLWK